MVFNIHGNEYRLVVAINYPYRMCYVRFVGSHQAYDRIDVTSVSSMDRAAHEEADPLLLGFPKCRWSLGRWRVHFRIATVVPLVDTLPLCR